MSEEQKPEKNGRVEEVKKSLKSLLDVRTGTDPYGTINRIKKNTTVYGANAWLLICSIMVASLGLDLNSPAVIIGAMLISPLMSPILGVGLSVAINDRKTLNTSLRHFGLAIAISLVTSTIYFLITPIGEVTSEILSRTKPTTLDVLVALFGGVAGIVSSSRKEISNALPGVAIATALMPPLCVTGFGIANANLTIALNSFYLFFLNSVFVALATYLVVKYLRFPLKEHSSATERKQARRLIAFFSFLIIIPSVFILRNLYLENQEQQYIQRFVDTYFDTNPKALEWSVINGDSTKSIILKTIGKELNKDSLKVLENSLETFGLGNYVLNVVTIDDLDKEQIKKIQAEVSNFKDVAEELKITKQEKSKSEQQLDSLNNLIQSIRIDNPDKKELIQQVKIAFEEIESLSCAQWLEEVKKDSFAFQEGLIVQWSTGTSSRLRKKKKEQLQEYLKADDQLAHFKLIESY